MVLIDLFGMVLYWASLVATAVLLSVNDYPKVAFCKKLASFPGLPRFLFFGFRSV